MFGYCLIIRTRLQRLFLCGLISTTKMTSCLLCQGQGSSRPRTKIFVLKVSSRSRTVFEDPIPRLGSVMGGAGIRSNPINPSDPLATNVWVEMCAIGRRYSEYSLPGEVVDVDEHWVLSHVKIVAINQLLHQLAVQRYTRPTTSSFSVVPRDHMPAQY